MCAYSGIGFNDIMLKSQSLLHFCFLTMIMRKMIKYYKTFSVTKTIKKLYHVISDKYRKFEKPKIS